MAVSLPSWRVSLFTSEHRDDDVINQKLVQSLEFETQEQKEKRQLVLEEIETVIQSWAMGVSVDKGLSPELAVGASAKLFTFGSYRLGVNDPSGDIDTLCVVNQLIRRDDCSSLRDVLSIHVKVSKLIYIPEAFVPVMKLYFDGVQVDLVFARLLVPFIPKDLDLGKLSYGILTTLDIPSIHSLNGCRVTDQILSLVPSPSSFLLALRCVKKWAKARGVYSNVMGFFGGVSWAMLTARVCQLYPNAVAAQIVSFLFKFLREWTWPSPVLINRIEQGGPLSHLVWTPSDNTHHLMPIITPAYPSMNSTHNVCKSTKRIILIEALRAESVVLDIEEGHVEWTALYEKLKFFEAYTTYIRIDCLAQTEADFIKCTGRVESQIRFIVRKLEEIEFIAFAHPNTLPFDFQSEKMPFARAYFIGLCFDEKNKKAMFSQTNMFIPILKKFNAEKVPGVDTSLKLVFSEDLPVWVFEDGIPPKKPKKRVSRKPPRTPPLPSSTIVRSDSSESSTDEDLIKMTPMGTPLSSPESVSLSSLSPPSSPHVSPTIYRTPSLDDTMFINKNDFDPHFADPPTTEVTSSSFLTCTPAAEKVPLSRPTLSPSSEFPSPPTIIEESTRSTLHNNSTSDRTNHQNNHNEDYHHHQVINRKRKLPPPLPASFVTKLQKTNHVVVPLTHHQQGGHLNSEVACATESRPVVVSNNFMS